ncbi:hypothetical protein LXL04_007169 [Taraxacum kok-saghyz]
MEARERDAIYQNSSPQANRVPFSIFSYPPLNSSNATRREPDPDPDPAEPVSETRPPPPPPPPLEAVVRYRECLKNHAASMGAHVVDGCGEFLANGEEGTPEGLKCAACECHRSFHRREVEGELSVTHVPPIHNPPPRSATMQRPHQQQQQQHFRYHRQTPPIMMAFGGNGVAPTESSSEDLDIYRTHAGRHIMEQPSKKRFRTKFSEEQKEKMNDFAERIGWKIQKQHEQEILQFCNEVGLKRNVFKVWMHNSKQAMKKKQPTVNLFLLCTIHRDGAFTVHPGDQF